MDFSLSAEQSLLKDTANRFLADRSRSADAKVVLWPEFAELGWLALPFPEAHGGLGASSVEVAIVAEALGRYLVVEPWVAVIVLAGGLLADAGAPAQLQAILPGIADGTRQIALAHTEPQARATMSRVATSARRAGDGWVLDGMKSAVIAGDTADHYLVSARGSGDVRAREGIALFILPRDAPGITVDVQRAVDGSSLGAISLRNVAAAPSDLVAEDAFAAIEQAFDRAAAAWCSESVGAMEMLLEATIAYTGTRIQFGRTLATNQVIRHRLADMAVALEEARSLALKATLSLDGAAAERGLAVSAAKVKVGRSGRFVAEQAVQLHGAMGVTDELRIGSYLKRLLVLDLLCGSAEAHLQRHVSLAARREAAG